MGGYVVAFVSIHFMFFVVECSDNFFVVWIILYFV
jgi:hypothetical protein